MERIDKIIATQTNYSRKEVKKLVQQKRVHVNGTLVCKSDMKIDEKKDRIELDGNEINIKKYIYLILNKPKGYISATKDKETPTVLDLVPKEYSHRNLFPAGRLDKDTIGMMIITDDGEFAHNILAPKKHIKKAYKVEIDIPINDKMINGFEIGVKLNDGICKTAILEKIDDKIAKVVLIEGRYHQIKRMFGCFGAKVINLERISMGNLVMPNDLKKGECRELKEEELAEIKEEYKVQDN